MVPLRKSWLYAVKFLWERFCIFAANKFHKHRLFEQDLANVGTDITSLPEFKEADVIHLHWINQGFLSLDNILKIVRSGKPIVWTMHDMWPFTGVCHYAGNCEKYKTGCHHCPILYTGGNSHDISHQVFEKKAKLYAEAHIHFVACSQWLEGLAKESRLFIGQEVCNIPNAINTHLFYPRNKIAARLSRFFRNTSRKVRIKCHEVIR